MVTVSSAQVEDVVVRGMEQVFSSPAVNGTSAVYGPIMVVCREATRRAMVSETTVAGVLGRVFEPGGFFCTWMMDCLSPMTIVGIFPAHHVVENRWFFQDPTTLRVHALSLLLRTVVAEEFVSVYNTKIWNIEIQKKG